MLHAGLDLSRRRLDVCLLSADAEVLEQTAAPPDADGLRGLVARVARYRQPVRAVIESMNGARFVHDTLEEHGWEVLVADAQKVKGLAPLACSTDRRGPISKHGPRYRRWGLFEAAMNACKHPLYAERYQHTKRRLGRQRGPKVAQIELSRKLTEAIWHMLTRNQPFAPAGTTYRLAA